MENRLNRISLIVLQEGYLSPRFLSEGCDTACSTPCLSPVEVVASNNDDDDDVVGRGRRRRLLLPAIVIIRNARAISVTMGRFPKRGGR